MGEPTLQKVYTIAEIARETGWSRLRMWRYLSTINAQLEGRLLVDVGRKGTPRWTVTKAALMQLNPSWFNEQQRLVDRVTELEERVDELEDLDTAKTTRIGELTRDKATLETRLAQLERERSGKRAA